MTKRPMVFKIVPSQFQRKKTSKVLNAIFLEHNEEQSGKYVIWHWLFQNLSACKKKHNAREEPSKISKFLEQFNFVSLQQSDYTKRAK